MTNLKDNQSSDDFLSKSLSIFNELSESLTSASPDEFLQVLPKKVCQLLSAPICILWQKDQKKPKLRVFATYGEVDDEYKKIELDLGHPGVSYIFTKNKVLSLLDVNEAIFRLADIDELNTRQWVSFLSTPLKLQEKIVGILDLFTQETRRFSTQEKNSIKILANYASLAFQKLDSFKDREEVSNDRDKLQELTSIMLEMTAASESKQVWNLLRKGSLKLVGSKPRIWMGRLNHLSGELEAVEPNDTPNIKFGEGITSQAIKDEKPIIVKDVLSEKWAGIYKERWSDTRSEMSIPILIDKVPIRENLEVKLGSKRIGILNIESSKIDNFPEIYQKRLLLLARHTALRLERLEFYRKFVALRDIEKEITKAQNYDEIIKTVIKGITQILEFTWVNISLIDSERTVIKSDYIFGLSKHKEEKFKQKAIHRLDSSDIQAEIVRTKQIKVPNDNDPGLDPEIFKDFEHAELIRVFIPMIEPSSGLVIGTVEAGYNRKYRQYVYEQDVQMLRSFVDYAVYALERRKSGLIDRIAHELKAPIVGIKSHASFLQTRFNDVRLSPNSIAIKLEDILTDCDLLYYQVKQIEYFLGRSSSAKPKFESIAVLRDIVIKAVNQLKADLDDYKLPRKGIEYRFGNTAKTEIFTDKTMLNQVIFNLLNNAIKYAEKDAREFKVLIEANDYKESLIIKFKDWGIGIKEEDKEKIFQEGFRALEAIRKVGGSGLGLSISKTIMAQIGGSLKLVNYSKPTEFHLILPKTLKEATNDPLR